MDKAFFFLKQSQVGPEYGLLGLFEQGTAAYKCALPFMMLNEGMVLHYLGSFYPERGTRDEL